MIRVVLLCKVVSAVPRLRWRNTDIGIPQLGLGTYQADVEVLTDAVEAALRMGYRLIDTAESYGNYDKIAAGLFRSGVPREEVFITTKLSIASYSHQGALESASLAAKALGYVDLMLLHFAGVEGGGLIVHSRPQMEVSASGEKAAEQRQDAWQGLEEAQSLGFVRHLGVSNFAVPHLEHLASFTNASVLHQLELHPCLQRPEVIAKTHELGMVVQAYGSVRPGGREELLVHPATIAVAAKHNMTSSQTLLRWALQKGFGVLPKSVSAARLAENLAVLTSPPLDAQDMSSIDEITCRTGECGAFCPAGQFYWRPERVPGTAHLLSPRPVTSAVAWARPHIGNGRMLEVATVDTFFLREEVNSLVAEWDWAKSRFGFSLPLAAAEHLHPSHRNDPDNLPATGWLHHMPYLSQIYQWFADRADVAAFRINRRMPGTTYGRHTDFTEHDIGPGTRVQRFQVGVNGGGGTSLLLVHNQTLSVPNRLLRGGEAFPSWEMSNSGCDLELLPHMVRLLRRWVNELDNVFDLTPGVMITHDARLPHDLVNLSPEPRLTLIIDVVANEWTQSLKEMAGAARDTSVLPAVATQPSTYLPNAGKWWLKGELVSRLVWWCRDTEFVLAALEVGVRTIFAVDNIGNIVDEVTDAAKAIGIDNRDVHVLVQGCESIIHTLPLCNVSVVEANALRPAPLGSMVMLRQPSSLVGGQNVQEEYAWLLSRSVAVVVDSFDLLVAVVDVKEQPSAELDALAPQTSARLAELAEPTFGRPLRDFFLIDLTHHMNHGTYGTCPKPVLDETKRFTQQMERSPDHFFESLPLELLKLRRRMAAYLQVVPSNIVFVDSASAGLNLILRSLCKHVSKEEAVVVLGSAHPVVGQLLKVCGGGVAKVPIPVPVDETAVLTVWEQHLQQIVEAGASIRLCVVSSYVHLPPALLPAARMSQLCKQYGAQWVVDDAAHAVGHIDEHVPELLSAGVDAWSSAAHKWLFSAKGSAIVVVSDAIKALLEPVSISFIGSSLDAGGLDWGGTNDPSSWLSMGAALDLRQEWGEMRLRRYQTQLCLEASELFAQAWGTHVEVAGAMFSVQIPGGQATASQISDALDAAHIRALVHTLPAFFMHLPPAREDLRWLRMSCQAFLELADFQDMLALLTPLLSAETSSPAQPSVLPPVDDEASSNDQGSSNMVLLPTRTPRSSLEARQFGCDDPSGWWMKRFQALCEYMNQDPWERYRKYGYVEPFLHKLFVQDQEPVLAGGSCPIAENLVALVDEAHEKRNLGAGGKIEEAFWGVAEPLERFNEPWESLEYLMFKMPWWVGINSHWAVFMQLAGIADGSYEWVRRITHSLLQGNRTYCLLYDMLEVRDFLQEMMDMQSKWMANPSLTMSEYVAWLRGHVASVRFADFTAPGAEFPSAVCPLSAAGFHAAAAVALWEDEEASREHVELAQAFFTSWQPMGEWSLIEFVFGCPLMWLHLGFLDQLRLSAALGGAHPVLLLEYARLAPVRHIWPVTEIRPHKGSSKARVWKTKFVMDELLPAAPSDMGFLDSSGMAEFHNDGIPEDFKHDFQQLLDKIKAAQAVIGTILLCLLEPGSSVAGPRPGAMLITLLSAPQFISHTVSGDAATSSSAVFLICGGTSWRLDETPLMYLIDFEGCPEEETAFTVTNLGGGPVFFASVDVGDHLPPLLLGSVTPEAVRMPTWSQRQQPDTSDSVPVLRPFFGGAHEGDTMFTVDFAWSHGVIVPRTIGLGVLYTALAAMHGPLTVVLGSGGGFVPRMAEGAQGRVIVVDVDLREDDVFSLSASHDIGASRDRQQYMNRKTLEAWRNTTRFAVWRASNELGKESIGYLHIDTCKTLDALLDTLCAWMPLVRLGGLISVHDTTPGTSTSYIEPVLRTLGFRILTLTHPGPVGLTLIQRTRREDKTHGNLHSLAPLSSLLSSQLPALATLPGLSDIMQWPELRALCSSPPELAALLTAFVYVSRPQLMMTTPRFARLLLATQQSAVDSGAFLVVGEGDSIVEDGVAEVWESEKVLESGLVPNVLVVESVDAEIVRAAQGALVLGVLNSSSSAHTLELLLGSALVFRIHMEFLVVGVTRKLDALPPGLS